MVGDGRQWVVGTFIICFPKYASILEYVTRSAPALYPNDTQNLTLIPVETKKGNDVTTSDKKWR